MNTIENRTMTRAEWKLHYGKERRLNRLRDWPNTGSFKSWSAKASICPHCSRVVTNRAYWGSNGKGSSHLKLTCKPEPAFKVPRQSWKGKRAYPMPAKPNYASLLRGQVHDRETFEAFWKHEIRFYSERDRD